MSRLFLRIALGILIVVIASNAVLKCGITTATRHQIESRLPDMLSSLGKVKNRLERVPVNHLNQELNRLQRHVHYRLSLLSPRNPSLPNSVRSRMNNGEPVVDFIRRVGWMIYIPIRDGHWLLVVGPISMFGRGAPERPIIWTIVAIIGIVLLTSFLLVAPIVARVRKLEQAAIRISSGELQARAQVESKDAIGRLAAGFNLMADKVQQLLERQKHLMQAVSHELRTPVARLRFGMEMLSMASEQKDRERRMAAIDDDLTELDQLIDELLLYLRSDDHALQIHQEELDAVKEIQTLAERLQVLRPEVSIQIQSVMPDNALLTADRELFKRAIKNVLNNAIKYASSRVRVRLQSGESNLIISIWDDGPGIPPADREKIFEPFARLDSSRSRETGGVGLGLAIVRRILQSHGGKVEVTDKDEGGACLVTIWPLV
jgi:two-component system sensor histidine kinase RstB